MPIVGPLMRAAVRSATAARCADAARTRRRRDRVSVQLVASAHGRLWHKADIARHLPVCPLSGQSGRRAQTGDVGTFSAPAIFHQRSFPLDLASRSIPIGMSCTSTIPAYQLTRTQPLGSRYFTRMTCTVSTDTHGRPIAAQAVGAKNIGTLSGSSPSSIGCPKPLLDTEGSSNAEDEEPIEASP